MKQAFINGQLYHQEGDTLIWEDECITAIGNKEDLEEKLKECDEVIDLKGLTVMPGFIDSHMHLLELGFYLSNVQLSGCTSLEQIAEICRKALSSIEKGQWLLGRGYNEDCFEKAVRPTKDFLDQISKDVPIALTRACGHVLSVNSKVLELAGIHEDLEMDGGRICFETGIVEENAINLIHGLQPEPTVEQMESWIETGMKCANRYGITTVGSDDFISVTDDYRTALDAFEKLSYQERMTVRVNEQCEFHDDEDFASFLDDGYTFDVGNDFFRIGPLKLILDGSLGARTAAMKNAYADDPDNKGTLCMSEEDMERDVQLAARFNMPVIAHCIGDRAVETWLSVLERNIYEGNPLHHGLVHCQIMNEEEIRKVTEMKLSCYYQSIFVDYDASILKDRVGDSLAKTSYPYRTLYEGTLCSNGSDAPVEMPDVMKGIQCAVTRKSLSYPGCAMNEEECLRVEEAVNTFTENGAKQLFMDDRIGYLKEGYYADLTVIDQDLLKTEPEKIAGTGIMMTVMNGKVVYQK